jgi:hypothetical protein
MSNYLSLCAGITALVFVTDASAQITGRQVPSPIVGITYDDVSRVSKETTTLQSIARIPTVRIVFDKGEPASYYLAPIQAFNPKAYIMGELIDSSYMKRYTTVSAVQTFTTNYTRVLGSQVDIWEIGNEVNGNWLSNLGNGSDVMPKVEAMYDIVSSQSGRTALTFFYEGEPSEPNNCIATDHGGNDMFTWINSRFSLNLPPSQRPAETEKIRLGLNYALISWYPDQCPGEMPNWTAVYTQLSTIFPNAGVGFGELGTANPQNGSTFEKNEISSIYPMKAGVGGLPPTYVSGVFWWYAAEEMVPWPGYLGSALNLAIQ